MLIHRRLSSSFLVVKMTRDDRRFKTKLLFYFRYCVGLNCRKVTAKKGTRRSYFFSMTTFGIYACTIPIHSMYKMFTAKINLHSVWIPAAIPLSMSCFYTLCLQNLFITIFAVKICICTYYIICISNSSIKMEIFQISVIVSCFPPPMDYLIAFYVPFRFILLLKWPYTNIHRESSIASCTFRNVHHSIVSLLL